MFSTGARVWQCLFQQSVFFVVAWCVFHFYGFWVKNYSLCKAAVLLSLHLSMGAEAGQCCSQKTMGLCHSFCFCWQSSALDPHGPSTQSRNSGANCVPWVFRCSAARIWGGREGEERKITSVTIFSESMISVKLAVKYLSVSLSPPQYCLAEPCPSCFLARNLGDNTCLLPDDELGVWV